MTSDSCWANPCCLCFITPWLYWLIVQSLRRILVRVWLFHFVFLEQLMEPLSLSNTCHNANSYLYYPEYCVKTKKQTYRRRPVSEIIFDRKDIATRKRLLVCGRGGVESLVFIMRIKDIVLPHISMMYRRRSYN